MRMKRILLAGLVALGLAPGTFVRSEPSPPDFDSPVSIERLDTKRLRAGPLVLEGAWVLKSENDHFGGYSALIARGPDDLLAANDRGRLMYLPRPDLWDDPPEVDEFLNFWRVDKSHVDLEALTSDPETGRVWAAMEWAQEITRFDRKLRQRASIRPAAMKDWPGNAGPESLVRLRSGEFIVIKEYPLEEGLHEALLFPEDPTDGSEPMHFLFLARDGFRPSDAALLPDGRIAVLLRGFRIGVPPRFPVMIAIADPVGIEEDEVLPSKVIARIADPLPSENYEGLTVMDEGGGRWDFWLISDDNFASYQRTLLLQLRWNRIGSGARQKARR